MGIMETIGEAARIAAYMATVRNLMFMTTKAATSFGSRSGTVIDEIVLHGTESLGTEDQSATYLTGTAVNSIHYFIGRDSSRLYSIVPEDKMAFHAGNPKKHPTVQDHNPRSIGIEMYQRDISVFKGDASKLDFTDWQYDTVAMLVYDIRRRRNISRDMVVAHHTINPIDRPDPRNFDWDRFNRQVDNISATLGNLLGPEYRLDVNPLLMMQVRGW
jgi:N-acetyl-anhydromuramyl-L-alanine amidase AmpD